MNLISEALSQYSEDHTSQESPLLKRINRDTHAGILKPRMLSGHLQGRLLSMVSKMIRPKTILEIGTYTGYSALCLLEGLTHHGKLITLDINEELEGRVRGYFKESERGEDIDFRIGNALKIIPELTGPFDLVWIDADKENYGNYYDLVIDKVPSGGFILADNVLWSGKVVEAKIDKDTRAIMDFNKRVQDDRRIENILLPVRDGIMMMRKV
ncbi:MAG: methyltransferase [Cyclobacteriaceae bacterium]|nr:methyltransferase [Cyclobacteriaceae bacterium]